MLKISSRADQVPPSPIRKLAPFANQAKAKGIEVIHLNIGQPDLKTPPSFMQAIKEANLDIISYAPSEGIPELRAKFSEYYKSLNYNIEVEDILVTNGGSEALLFAFMACLDPGDELIVTEPFYANYLGFAKELGITLVPITTNLAENFESPTIEEFETKITTQTKAILISNPNNPTGKVLSRKELTDIANFVTKHNLFVIADEVYNEFVYNNEKHISVLEIPEIAQHTILIDSISKRYSACGARIGTLVTRNKDIMQNVLKLAQARLSVSTLEQIGACTLMDLPRSYFEANAKTYENRRNTLVNGLKQINGVEVGDVNGAFYLMVKLPVEDTEDFCKWMLESFSHNNTTVMMAPASGFYITPGLGKNEVRMAYVLEEDKIIKALECLTKGLETYNK